MEAATTGRGRTRRLSSTHSARQRSSRVEAHARPPTPTVRKRPNGERTDARRPRGTREERRNHCYALVTNCLIVTTEGEALRERPGAPIYAHGRRRHSRASARRRSPHSAAL